MTTNNEIDELELFKLKSQVKRLESLQTNRTSVVTLLCPPSEQISSLVQMLNTEATKADCIKSRVNRQAVQQAIQMASYRLSQYHSMPKNGLCVFTGEVIENNKLRRVAIDFSPCRPVNNFLYSCDGSFHLDDVKDLLNVEEAYGFMIMDGKQLQLYKVQGAVRTLLYNKSVDLPKKHGRGGQSSVRFARLRLEARQHYVTFAVEALKQVFIDPQTMLVNVSAIIFAGSAEFKEVVYKNEYLDPRIKKAVVKQVDIAYGAERGLEEAIALSQDVLTNCKIYKEVALLDRFFTAIQGETNQVSYGIADVMRCLQMSAVESIIVDQGCNVDRVVYQKSDGSKYVVYMLKDSIIWSESGENPSSDDSEDSRDNLIDWLISVRKDMNFTINLISDASSEGNQFIKGFQGIAAFLKWPVDLVKLDGYMAVDGQGGDQVEDDLSDLSDFI